MLVSNLHYISTPVTVEFVFCIWILEFLCLISADQKSAQNYIDLGTTLLAQGQLSEAIQQFHYAVEVEPTNYLIYYKRATSYAALGRGNSAINDLNKVLELRPEFHAAKLQRSNMYLKQGRFSEAISDLTSIAGEDKVGLEAKSRLSSAEKLSSINSEMQEIIDHDNDYQTGMPLLTNLIESCPWSIELRQLRAKIYETLGEINKAIIDIKAIAKLTNDNTEAYLKISKLYYSIAQEEESLREIRECLKLDQDHKECFKHYKKVKKLDKIMTEGRNLMESGDYHRAIENFRKILKTESDNINYIKKLSPLLCQCHSDNKEASEAIKQCSEAHELNPNDEDILAYRAEAYLLNEQFDDAIRDFQAGLDINSDSRKLKDGLKKAQKMQKQSQKRDYYKILGVKRTATKREIEKAYRKLAHKWHPDSFKKQEDKAAAEKKFMDIASAKEVLTDDEKRAAFDRGEDPLDPEEQARGHNPFQDGGFPFPFGGEGGNFQFKFHFG